jgi:GT2 family glycosyltransferase
LTATPTSIDTSIVLATCSRAHLLRGALASLLTEAKAWSLPVEFIIVDDGSTDETPAVLAAFQQEAQVPVTIVPGERRGIAAARNLGAQRARGTWLASFDDDQVALPGWLVGLRELADEQAVVCVSGALELSLPPGRTLAELGPRARRILGEHLHGDIPSRDAIDPASNNVLVRREVFQQLRGYDVTFTEGAEDADLFDRMHEAGYSTWFQPTARALHITPESRMERRNLRWTSLRLGASDARRHAQRGLIRLFKLLLIRAGVTVLRDLPHLGITSLTRDPARNLDVQCSLWYSEGLFRAAPTFLLSRGGNDSAFLRSLDFRSRNGERSENTVKSTSS